MINSVLPNIHKDNWTIASLLLLIVVKHNFPHLNPQPYILDTVCIGTSLPLLRAYLNAWVFLSLTILSMKVSRSLIIPLVHVKCTEQTFTTLFHQVMNLCGTELLLSHEMVLLMKYLSDTCTFLWTLAYVKLTYTFQLGNGYQSQKYRCVYILFFSVIAVILKTRLLPYCYRLWVKVSFFTIHP
jgi:hypothetical protein